MTADREPPKNPAAELARLRWAGLSAEERSAIARKAVRTRWARARARKAAQTRRNRARARKAWETRRARTETPTP
jgi:hypothetical protein